jgi:ribonuclease HI
MKFHLYTDGGARGNPGPGGIGVLLCDAEDQEIMRHKDRIGPATNNIAEYCALIAGLELARAHHATEVQCSLDSELVVKQMRGEYKVKNENMKKLFFEVKAGERYFKRVTYMHLPRTHAKMRIADRLVNQALDGCD